MRPSAALLPFSLMVMAIMTVPTLVLDEQGLPRYRHLRAELQELEESNEELVRAAYNTSLGTGRESDKPI